MNIIERDRWNRLAHYRARLRAAANELPRVLKSGDPELVEQVLNEIDGCSNEIRDLYTKVSKREAI